jgi:glycosyltransferase involved in cell wall biosynthesis
LKILLLNQAFHPDVVATAQLLTDAAQALARRGHEVTVIAGRRAYDDPARKFPAREEWGGIRIIRIGNTAFGKRAKWRRATDFASFIVACVWRLLWLPRPDAVVALTSPPLISFIGAWFAKLRGAKFFYWVMDLNPDEAIAAGWLREGSFTGRVLHRMSRFSFRRAEKIIALDRFMRARIEAKGIAPEKVAVIAPWSHDEAVRFDLAGREAFRRAHGLGDKFVVMYSGNHSPCHPLDTLLAAAKRLAGDGRFVFLFVGGGSEFRKIQAMANTPPPASVDPVAAPRESAESSFPNRQSAIGNRQSAIAGPSASQPSTLNAQRSNVRCLPYQPLNGLSGSLSAADLHVVVMGNAFVGTIHPCKIYNVVSVGAPVLYIGPGPSHLSEVLDALGSKVCGAVVHGDVDHCVREIHRIAADHQRGEAERYEKVAREFSQPVLLPRLIAELESQRSES